MANFCTKCGTKIEKGNFCPNCGAPVTDHPQPLQPEGKARQAEAQTFVQDPSLPQGIYRDENGAYHWIYRLNMLKNPTVMLMFIKVFGALMGGVAVITALVKLFDGDPEDIPQAVLPWFVISAGMIVLVLIIWLVMAAVRGGYYIVEHMMTENKVIYLSTPEERKKARGWAKFGFILGAATSNMTLLGNSAALAASERFDSTYTDVKSIKADRKHDVIKVKNVLQHNTIYAAPHQFDFVYNYIVSHCPNAKIK